MPQYHFHVRKNGHTPDTTDVELSNSNEARRAAARLMGEELKAYPDSFWNDEEWHIEVMDDRGLILFTLYSAGIRSAALWE